MNRLATLFMVSVFLVALTIPPLSAQQFQATGQYTSESSLYYPAFRIVVRYNDTTGGTRYGFPTVHDASCDRFISVPPGTIVRPGMPPGAAYYTNAEIPVSQRRQSASYRESGIKKRRSK